MSKVVKYKADKLIEEIANIEKKIKGLSDNSKVRYKILSALEQGIREEEFIPYTEPHVGSGRDKQHLQDNVTVTEDYIWWKNTYADEKYNDDFVSRRFHINASPEWDKAYLEQYGDRFEELVADIIMEDLFDG